MALASSFGPAPDDGPQQPQMHERQAISRRIRNRRTICAGGKLRSGIRRVA
jgi:hypothetical protein